MFPGLDQYYPILYFLSQRQARNCCRWSRSWSVYYYVDDLSVRDVQHSKAYVLYGTYKTIPGVFTRVLVPYKKTSVSCTTVIIIIIRLAIRQCAAWAFTLINRNILERKNLRIRRKPIHQVYLPSMSTSFMFYLRYSMLRQLHIPLPGTSATSVWHSYPYPKPPWATYVCTPVPQYPGYGYNIPYPALVYEKCPENRKKYRDTYPVPVPDTL